MIAYDDLTWALPSVPGRDRRVLLEATRVGLALISSRAREAALPVYIQEIAELWRSRLDEASRLPACSVVPADAAAALAGLLHSVESLELTDLADWAELLPRTALQLLDVRAVATLTQAPQPSPDRSNQLPTQDDPWQAGRRQPRLAVAA